MEIQYRLRIPTLAKECTGRCYSNDSESAKRIASASLAAYWNSLPVTNEPMSVSFDFVVMPRLVIVEIADTLYLFHGSLAYGSELVQEGKWNRGK